MAFGRLKRAWRRLQQWRLDPPLAPATAEERAQVEALRAEFRAFPDYDVTGLAPSMAEWQSNLNELRDDVLERDPRRFTRFPVVLKTMFVHEADYLETELAYLRTHRDWDARWQTVLRECGAGYAPAYRGYPATSGNLLHNVYHLARFSDATGLDPARLGFVLEFGGGYGSLCRVFHRSGFAGRYLIFDFPHFSALQRYFLRSAGVRVHDSADAFRAATDGVFFVNTPEALDAVLPASGAETLFVATWSLSETPEPLRAAIAKRVASLGAYLVALQDRFNEMDNQAWFAGPWTHALGPQMHWQRLPIPHIPGNAYLFGVRRP